MIENYVDVLWMGETMEVVLKDVLVWSHVVLEYCVAWPKAVNQDKLAVVMECKSGAETIRLHITGGFQI